MLIWLTADCTVLSSRFVRNTRAAYTIVVLVILSAGGFLLLWRPSERRIQQVNSRHGAFRVIDVTRRGEPFRSGSPLERVLRVVLPNQGLSVGDFQLRKPVEFAQWQDAPLTVWLLYRGTNIRQGVTPPLFGSRVVAENSAGRQIENPLPLIRGRLSNELLISVPLFAFPRDQKTIHVRFSPPAESEMSREWINFEINNPFRNKPERWVRQGLPATNVVEGEQVVLRQMSINPVICDFELPGAGWHVSHCSIRDPEGNAYQASSTRRNSKSPHELQRGFAYSLETNMPWESTPLSCAPRILLRATCGPSGSQRTHP
jgi:hypothetical protein